MLYVHFFHFDLTILYITNSYKNYSKFEADVGVANETVTFEINGANYTCISGEYIITSQYGSAVISNKITISLKKD